MTTGLHSRRQSFEKFVLDCRTLFGEDLVSVLLYGSAAGDEFQPDASDLNLAVVLRSAGADGLRRASRKLGRWRKWGITAPLVLDVSMLESGARVFPIEMAEMKRTHRLLFGTDPFLDLSIDTRNLRAQCEYEMQAKLLSLRQGYLREAGSAPATLELIQDALKSFLIIMRNALSLLGESPPPKMGEVLDRVESRWGVALPTWRRVLATRRGEGRVRKAEIHPLFSAFLEEARAVVGRFAEPLEREDRP